MAASPASHALAWPDADSGRSDVYGKLDLESGSGSRGTVYGERPGDSLDSVPEANQA